jgi:hypothetical protein
VLWSLNISLLLVFLCFTDANSHRCPPSGIVSGSVAPKLYSDFSTQYARIPFFAMKRIRLRKEVPNYTSMDRQDLQLADPGSRPVGELDLEEAVNSLTRTINEKVDDTSKTLKKEASITINGTAQDVLAELKAQMVGACDSAQAAMFQMVEKHVAAETSAQIRRLQQHTEDLVDAVQQMQRSKNEREAVAQLQALEDAVGKLSAQAQAKFQYFLAHECNQIISASLSQWEESLSAARKVSDGQVPITEAQLDWLTKQVSRRMGERVHKNEHLSEPQKHQLQNMVYQQVNEAVAMAVGPELEQEAKLLHDSISRLNGISESSFSESSEEGEALERLAERVEADRQIISFIQQTQQRLLHGMKAQTELKPRIADESNRPQPSADEASADSMEDEGNNVACVSSYQSPLPNAREQDRLPDIPDQMSTTMNRLSAEPYSTNNPTSEITVPSKLTTFLLRNGHCVSSCVLRGAQGDKCEIFLIGALHVSTSSEALVEEALTVIDPDCVCLELCPHRAQLVSGEVDDILPQSSLRNPSLSITDKFVNWLGSMQQKLGEAMGSQVGKEQITAARIALSRQISVCLCDRDEFVTLDRALRKMTLWEKFKRKDFMHESIHVL